MSNSTTQMIISTTVTCLWFVSLLFLVYVGITCKTADTVLACIVGLLSLAGIGLYVYSAVANNNTFTVEQIVARMIKGDYTMLWVSQALLIAESVLLTLTCVMYSQTVKCVDTKTNWKLGKYGVIFSVILLMAVISVHIWVGVTASLSNSNHTWLIPEWKIPGMNLPDWPNIIK
jgi:hypothetical protein